MKHVLEGEFPKGNMLQHLETWGHGCLKIGEAFSPVLKSLRNGLCEVPLWGYLEKREIKVVSMDQTFGFISEVELFYIPTAQVTGVVVDVPEIDFSPQHLVLELSDDIDKIITKD